MARVRVIISLLAAWVCSAASARADGMDIALSRLSRGRCERTLAGASNFALDVDGAPVLHVDRAAYARLAAELAVATAAPVYQPLSTLGSQSFVLSVDTQLTDISQGDHAFRSGTAGSAQRTCDGQNRSVDSFLVGNRLRFEKGLPLGLSLGAHAGKVHGVGLYVAGAFAKMAIVEGMRSPWVPDIALRLAATALAGETSLSLFTWQAELFLSKTWPVRGLFIAPYAGATLLATHATTSRIDLTPNIDSLACARGSDAVCHAAGLARTSADFAHDQRFPSLWLLRMRATLGAMVRRGRFALLAEVGFDPVSAARINAEIHGAFPRQWSLAIAPSALF